MYLTLGLLFLVVVVAVLWRLGPRVDVSVVPVDPLIPDDVDDYIWASEAAFPGIVAGTEKHVEWHGEPLEKTPYSIVYIHGFSACRHESSPVPEIVAKQLGANIYFTRLTGHGLGGDAMARATVNDWYNDTLEAFRIGQRIGEKVIVMACSTGAALATWVMLEQHISAHAVIQVVPNYKLKARGADLLAGYWGYHLARLTIGEERSRPLAGGLRDVYWTPSYPVEALLPMIAVTQAARRLEFRRITTPQLWLYAINDQVVDAKTTGQLFHKVGSKIKQARYLESESDPMGHLVLGDVCAPHNTVPAAQEIIIFLEMVEMRGR